MAKCDKKKDGSQWFTVAIKSIPEPFLVQWSKKEKNDDTVQLINVNAEEYKGSSRSLPQPVLVVKQRELLENFNFQIEVQSFVGKCKKTIHGKKKVFCIFLKNRKMKKRLSLYDNIDIINNFSIKMFLYNVQSTTLQIITLINLCHLRNTNELITS